MKYSEATEACNPHLQGSKNLEFQLALRTSISQNCPCPGQVLVCSFNDFKFKADNVPKFLCPLSKSEWKLNKGTCTCTCPEERSTCPGWPDGTFLSTSLILLMVLLPGNVHVFSMCLATGYLQGQNVQGNGWLISAMILRTHLNLLHVHAHGSYM